MPTSARTIAPTSGTEGPLHDHEPTASHEYPSAADVTSGPDRWRQRPARHRRVLHSYGAANRDERHFPDPDRFDVRRTPVDHLGFGYGNHACAGQGLARLEVHAVLGPLAARVRRIELTGEPVRALNNITRGFRSLPVRGG